MISAKMGSPGLLKITVFWNKGYGVKISVDDVTNKILWHDSNYFIEVLDHMSMFGYIRLESQNLQKVQIVK